MSFSAPPLGTLLADWLGLVLVTFAPSLLLSALDVLNTASALSAVLRFINGNCGGQSKSARSPLIKQNFECTRSSWLTVTSRHKMSARRPLARVADVPRCIGHL